MDHYEQMEAIVDKLVPIVLIALALLIVSGLFVDLHEYEPWVSLIDSFVISFFIVDLYFKWRSVHGMKEFFKMYWLDLLAVFPFYLLFRFLIFATEIARVEEAQKFLHEAALLRDTAKGAREIKAVEESSKLIRFLERSIRPLQRIIRFIAAEVHEMFGHFVHRHAKVQNKL